MSVSALPVSTQNYLKVIWGLLEWTDEPVATSDIATRMGLTASTVSEGIRRLGEQGLVEHARYRRVTLTPEGRVYALAMVRRHRLLETFLVEVLHYGWDEVHEEAEQLEHAVSDLLVDRVDALLGHPARDPHGDPIPSPDGGIALPSAEPLSAVPAGTAVVVERISDEDPALLQFLADHGIRVGTRLTPGSAAPFSDTVEVRAEGADAGVALGHAVRTAIWVSRAGV